MNLRETIVDIFREGLSAVLPENLIRDTITLRGNTLEIAGKRFALPPGSGIHVFGSGKASIASAKFIADILSDRISGGLIVSSYHDTSIGKIQVYVGSHPIPDEKSLRVADLLIDRLSILSKEDFFIYLLSGGSSSLIEKPMPPLILEDLKQASKLFMNAGASIYELNTLRKHLSMIKGGRLAQVTKARGVVLVISDVIGDDLETIGSAPFYEDRSTFSDVGAILSKYNLWDRIPNAVKALVEKGLDGQVEETPKEPPSRIEHMIIGNNRKALQGAKEKAVSLGLNAHIMTSRLRGEAKEIAKAIVAMGEEIVMTRSPFDIPVCLIFGGETTVTVQGDGKGGRNQEMCLSALREIGHRPGMVFLSAGTDGIDGNSEAAGAVIDSRSFQRIQEFRLSIDDYQRRNDSTSLFKQTGDLIITGPTGTNVMDITLLLIGEKGGI